MSEWKQPGQPYDVTIAGRVVKLEPITVRERGELAQKIALLDIKAKPGGLVEFIECWSRFVKEIQGTTGTVDSVLAVQSTDILMKLYRAILSGGALSESERKNSPLPLDSSSPAAASETAKETADLVDASTSAA